MKGKAHADRGTSESRSDRWMKIYEAVARIPKGRVATYGQVAAVAGLPGCARQVGYALHRLSEGSALPWHRVLGAGGRISLPGGSGAGALQRILLEAEGVRFDAGGNVPLAAYGWRCEGFGSRPSRAVGG